MKEATRGHSPDHIVLTAATLRFTPIQQHFAVCYPLFPPDFPVSLHNPIIIKPGSLCLHGLEYPGHEQYPIYGSCIHMHAEKPESVV